MDRFINDLLILRDNGEFQRQVIVTQADAAIYHSACLMSDGSCWCWGSNNNGQLGDNTTTNKSVPTSVVGAHSFIQISAGGGNNWNFSGGLKADGSVWTWGMNNVYQLGDDTAASKSSPVSVVGNHSFIKLCMGHYNGAGLKSDGSVWAWGYGPYGAVGDNTGASRSSPTKVVGEHSFVDLAGGAANFMAIKSDGTIWGWGMNDSGQLGDNSITNRLSPVSVVGNHSFTAIAFKCSLSMFCALKSDGTVWTWGTNAQGNLADGTTVSKSSPVSVIGNHSFVKIAGNIALKADGTAWTWGYNASGQLGDNSITNRTSPVAVVGGHSFTAVFSDNYSTKFAIKEDSSLLGMGWNDTYGNLGDGTMTNRSSPVLVLPRGSRRWQTYSNLSY